MPRSRMLTTLAVCALLASFALAEETIHFREGGGSGYTDVSFDDTWIDPNDNNTHGNDGYNGIKASTSCASLIAVKDLFTELPLTSGGANIQINSATLHLFRYQGTSSTTMSVYRVTTDWLPDSAGNNENDVSGEHAEKSESTDWASGDFSSSDYDTSEVSTGAWGNNYNEELTYDVTGIVADIYDAETNYGLVLKSSDLIYGRASEYGTAGYRPSLEIAYEYVASGYTLTVNSGTGDGTYDENDTPTITADTAPSGQDFDKWVGDTSGVATQTSSSTTLTMPAANQEVTATYTDKTWTLTVNNGTGDGSYAVDTVVPITASAAPSGQDFDEWIGDTEGMASLTSSSTNLTMPYGNAEVTATYTDKTWTLTVNSGTGDGSYVVATVVNIDADTAPLGKAFDEWVGDTTGIASATTADTTLTMPYGNAEITAVYRDLTYTLTVNSGTGDGSYTANTVVDINADAAPSGKAFDEWVGTTEGIADLTDPSTNITMPAANAETTATYADVYALTVNSGTGDGGYTESTIVDIDADSAASGMLFDAWTGDTSGVSDINDPSGTLTMPASAAEITATYAEVVSGLVSRYTFDTDARDTYGTNDGTLANGASVATDGTRGSVLSLDGDNDYASLPSGAMAAGRSELTLSMWVKPDTWEHGDTVYDEYAEGQYWQFSLTYSGFYTRDSSTGTMGSRDNNLTTPSLATGSWQHIAMLYSVSGDEKTIYLDGEPVASTSISIDALTSSRDGVGIGHACDGNHFDGLVDDVRLYNRALSDAEIALLADATSPTYYSLTVNSGSGSGTYTEGTVVDIAADSPATNHIFDQWTGDTSGIANLANPTTELTMPAADAEITATYTDLDWTLTVNSGSGDGDYIPGTIVDISADTAPSGQEFDEWAGDTSGIASLTSASTTLTMPYGDAEITATYTDKTWTLTVNSGTGDGSYVVATAVDIDADAPASGKQFDEWIGDTSGIASVTTADTTLTMPYAHAEITATYEDVASGTTQTIVDWEDSEANNVYDLSDWDNVYKHTYLSYSSAGPDGLVGATTSRYATCGVNGSSESFAEDDQIVVTWYNGTGSSVTFTPKISFNDPDYYNGGSSGTWYDMSQLQLDDGETGTTGYTFTSGTAGSYSRVHVCRNINNKGQLMFDKFQLVTDGGGAATYTLTVNSGSGDGQYAEDAVADIDANAAPSGYVFDEWIGDTTGIASVTTADTTLTMPASDADITATYEAATLHTLTVNSGTGDGSYQENWVVDITADAAASGKQFDKWVGDTSGIASVGSSSTTLTMPGSNAEITASYTDATITYTLTVNSGTGDGNYAESAVADITADTAPSGYVFDQWVGDTSGIASVSAADTTLTMPASNQEVTATYEAATLYTLTVNSGSGDGSYQEGYAASISADSPASGKVFNAWVGDTSGIADIGDPTTTLTMPAANQEITATYDDVPVGDLYISSVSDSTPSHGQSITISGSNFGSKSQASPLIWDNFESGSVGQSLSTGGIWSTDGTAPKYSSDYNRAGSSVNAKAVLSTFSIDGNGRDCFVKSNLNFSSKRIYVNFWLRFDEGSADPNDTDGTYQIKTWRICQYPTSGELYPALSFFPHPDIPEQPGINSWNYYQLTRYGSGATSFTVPAPSEHQWMSVAAEVYEGTPNGNDGTIKIWHDNTLVVDTTTTILLDSTNIFRGIRFGEYIGGGGLTATNYFDDIYVDNSWAHVEIGNDPDYEDCSHREIQIPTAWSNSSITVDFNKGSFSSGTVYLFVVDADGDASGGYAVTVN